MALTGWLIDPLDTLTPQAKGAECDRRSRIAYQAWVEACSRTGVNVKIPWESLLDDEKGQWSDVYGVCVESERKNEAGVS